MFNYIRIIIVLSLFTSCMQVKTKKDLDFDGQDSSAVSQPNEDDDVVVSKAYSTEFIGTRSMNVRYGDYKFMTTALNQRFGPSCASTITNNIWNKAEVFGAVCDYYDRDKSCNNANLNNPLVLTSTMRAGRVMKACEEITDNANCVSYYLGNAGLSASSAFNSTNLLKAYKVFYPLKEEMTELEIEAFMNLGKKFSRGIDRWKAVSLALCVSPEWQIP